MLTTDLPDWLKTIYPFQGKLHQGPNGKMHYLDEGNGEAVLLLHGNPTWSFYYRNLIKVLSKNFRCIAPDHLGCGLSEIPENYSYQLADRIKDIEHLMDALEIKSCHLVVHDWGGAIGMGYATKHPDRIKRITILNTAAFPSQYIPTRINLCKSSVFGKFLVCGLNGFAGPATFMASKKGLRRDIKRAYLYPYSNYQDREAIYQFVRDIPMKPNHPSWKTLEEIDKDLSKLHDKPMLIGWGAHDFCFNDRFLEQWKKRFPEARVEYYEDAGHYILEDAEDEINHQISDFFRI